MGGSLKQFLKRHSYRKTKNVLKDYEIIKMNELINLYPDSFNIDLNKLNSDIDKLKEFIDINKRKPFSNSEEIHLIKIWINIRDRRFFNIYVNSYKADEIYKNFITDQ